MINAQKAPGELPKLHSAPALVTIFMEDSESRWTEAEIRRFQQEGVFGAAHFIREQGKKWGRDLHFRQFSYGAMVYPGRIGTYEQEEDYSRDLPEKAAERWGFSSPREMDRMLSEHLHKKERVYLFLVNKPGRSYSLAGEWRCLVIFAREPQGNRWPGVVAHELLHLHGAEDYYDPFGRLPRRKALAERLYPDDIMMTVYPDIRKNSIGEATAWSIGWQKTPPDAVRDPDWNR